METKQVEGEIYEGPASAFNDSRFVNFETVLDKGNVELSIKEVVALSPDFKFENGTKIGKKTLCLKFEKTPKVLRINAGNRKKLIEAIGNDTKKWIGLKIVIFGDPNIRFGPVRKGGVVVNSELTINANKPQ